MLIFPSLHLFPLSALDLKSDALIWIQVLPFNLFVTWTYYLCSLGFCVVHLSVSNFDRLHPKVPSSFYKPVSWFQSIHFYFSSSRRKVTSARKPSLNYQFNLNLPLTSQTTSSYMNSVSCFLLHLSCFFAIFFLLFSHIYILSLQVDYKFFEAGNHIFLALPLTALTVSVVGTIEAH